MALGDDTERPRDDGLTALPDAGPVFGTSDEAWDTTRRVRASRAASTPNDPQAGGAEPLPAFTPASAPAPDAELSDADWSSLLQALASPKLSERESAPALEQLLARLVDDTRRRVHGVAARGGWDARLVDPAPENAEEASAAAWESLQGHPVNQPAPAPPPPSADGAGPQVLRRPESDGARQTLAGLAHVVAREHAAEVLREMPRAYQERKRSLRRSLRAEAAAASEGAGVDAATEVMDDEEEHGEEDADADTDLAAPSSAGPGSEAAPADYTSASASLAALLDVSRAVDDQDRAVRERAAQLLLRTSADDVEAGRWGVGASVAALLAGVGGAGSGRDAGGESERRNDAHVDAELGRLEDELDAGDGAVPGPSISVAALADEGPGAGLPAWLLDDPLMRLEAAPATAADLGFSIDEAALEALAARMTDVTLGDSTISDSIAGTAVELDAPVASAEDRLSAAEAAEGQHMAGLSVAVGAWERMEAGESVAAWEAAVAHEVAGADAAMEDGWGEEEAKEAGDAEEVVVEVAEQFRQQLRDQSPVYTPTSAPASPTMDALPALLPDSVLDGMFADDSGDEAEAVDAQALAMAAADAAVEERNAAMVDDAAPGDEPAAEAAAGGDAKDLWGDLALLEPKLMLFDDDDDDDIDIFGLSGI
jgi:hypothetical protein